MQDSFRILIPEPSSVFGIVYAVYKDGAPVYVGQTVLPLAERWKDHCKTSLKHNFKLRNAIQKYGRGVFQMKVLAQAADAKQLDDLEIFFIALFRTYWEWGSGYNMTLGGNGPRRRLLLQNHLGELIQAGKDSQQIAKHFGCSRDVVHRHLQMYWGGMLKARIHFGLPAHRPQSEKFKAHMREVMQGFTPANPNRGKKLSPEHRAKIGAANKAAWEQKKCPRP